jgi:ankyrin repeat protein
MHAAKDGHVDIVKALIEAGADVNAIDTVRH